jgi:hypothetical protein
LSPAEVVVEEDDGAHAVRTAALVAIATPVIRFLRVIFIVLPHG